MAALGRHSANTFLETSPHRLHLFHQAVTRQSVAAAARACNMTPKSIRDAIDIVTALAGGRRLIEYPGANKDTLMLTEYGRAVDAKVAAVLDAITALDRISPTKCVLSALPHHALWMGAVIQKHADILDFNVLDEVDRLIDRFDVAVVGPLLVGATDAVVGLKPTGAAAKNLNIEDLYQARLMAQILTDDPQMMSLVDDERITLRSLIRSPVKLLVPPPGVRSRQLLTEALTADMITSNITVGYESFETKVLCHYGRLGLGITVLPSDIARPFSHGGEFGANAGAEDSHYHWYPIVDHDGNDITHQVSLTYRMHPHPEVDTIVQSILDAVQDPTLLASLTGHYNPTPN
ncbi:LysR family transcriptional regulator [Mycolicibacterium neoaurum]|uniref:LysR family transcriptional regulator n=1 Tax=Mycolicibacterium neoaurum TaxID=1795 RepID=UPI00114D4B5C|nr:LysR family transcriptional regulator [Mycolicibacterium neoaurum]